MGVSHSSAIHNAPGKYGTKYTGPVEQARSQAETWKEYDYVIVGGGTAGCVLASGLSEDPKVSVLLLEAGRSHEGIGLDLTRIPLAYIQTFRTSVDWNFYTTPQKQLDDKKIYWPRGKVLGGCSAINAAIYQHCSPSDFDEWAQKGAPGWAYDDLKKYFRKAEKYTPDPHFPEVKTEDRGTAGYWSTGHPKGVAPVVDLIVKACESLGLPYNPDLNTPRNALGVTKFLGNIDPHGSRSSTATAYLNKDVLSRPNLHVGVGVTAERIIFSENNDTPLAIGVLFAAGPQSPRYGVRAKREVILSAGAVGSPQLLLLSGVGPAGSLQKLDIPVIKDLPHVGQNLADHITTGGLHFRTKDGVSWDYLSKPLHGALALVNWLVRGAGPMASMGTASGAFLRSDDARLPLVAGSSKQGALKDLTSGPGAPDLELMWAPIVLVDFGFTAPPPGTQGLTMGAVALRPESTGTITLKSNSVWDQPVIDANYFSSEHDMDILVRGIRFLLTLGRTEPLASVLDPVEPTTDTSNLFWPGNRDPAEISDAEIRQWTVKNACPVFHPVSTARMGLSAETSVVDTQLRVHGIIGLRVVDASVFPTQLSGHPCAAVVAIAEKASDLIRGHVID